MKRAATLDEIHQSCDPRPLRREELASFFISTAHARDPVLSRREQLRQRLLRDPHGNQKLLLAGHSGSGKSTELVKLTEELGPRFLVVGFSVAQECNLAHVPLEDVLIVMMERLLRVLRDEHLDGDVDTVALLAPIRDWLARDVRISERDQSAEAETGAGLDARETLLARVLGLAAHAKVSLRRREVRVQRRTEERPRRLGELIDLCNTLLGAVRAALQQRERWLVVLLEDLDKISLADARRIFIEQAPVLAELRAPLIATIPIFLLHSPDRGPLDQHFESFVLPMPKVTEFDGSACAEGRGVLREIVLRRLDPALVEATALETALAMCGGVLRDLFEVLVVAAEAADSLHVAGRQAQARIEADNVRYALNRRKSEYARSISTVNLPSEWHLTNEDLYARLKQLAGRPTRTLPVDHASMVLLQAKAVLEYNGEQWFGVHPLVAELVQLLPA